MIISGFLISIATFPGIMVHELAHALFCRWTNTPVFKVCYFRFGNPAGYVLHGRPDSVWHHILIGIGPFFVNTLLGLAMGLAAYLLHVDIDHLTFASGVFLWLAISIAMHSFPSTGDAHSIWEALWLEGAPVSARLVGAPLVIIISMGAIGSIFWLDAIYGFGVVMELPKLIFQADTV